MAQTNGQQVSTTRRKVLAAMGGSAAVGLAGCPDGNGNGESADSEFIASVGANPGTFDPTIITDASSNSVVGTLSYDALLGLTFDLSEFRPELATDWEQVDDTTLQFQLREGVEFHNGDEFVADDVEFSINRMRDTTNAASVAWIEEVNVLGDYEVEITSAEPFAPALSYLSGVPILPNGADGISETPGDDDHAFDEDTLGTGPFALDRFEPEDRVILSAFDNYWYDGDDHPSTAPWDTVIFRVIPEQVSQEEAMHAGELDLIDNAAPWDLDQWGDATAEVITGDAVGFDFVSYPVNQSPYTNEKFRRGITRLIPRSEVIEAIFGGNATALGGPISPGLGSFWDEDHEQELLDEYVGEDEEEGLQLLEEAFQEEDIEPPFDVSLITNVNRTRERWMEVVQQRLDETEYFNAELDVRAFSDLVPFLTSADGAAESTDIVGIGWTGGSDPDGHVVQLLHSDNHVPGGFNWNLYENEEVDQLIDEGRSTIDTAGRRDAYHQLQEVLAQDVPSAFMWTSDQIDVVNPDGFDDTGDWQPHPNSSYRYKALYAPNLGQVTSPPQ